MYQQDFSPIGDSLALSALFASLPLITIFILIGVRIYLQFTSVLPWMLL